MEKLGHRVTVGLAGGRCNASSVGLVEPLNNGTSFRKEFTGSERHRDGKEKNSDAGSRRDGWTLIHPSDSFPKALVLPSPYANSLLPFIRE